jgi:hypothetical protein
MHYTQKYSMLVLVIKTENENSTFKLACAHTQTSARQHTLLHGLCHLIIYH